MRTLVLFLVILLLHVGELAAQTSILDREVSLEKGDASLGSILLQIGEKGSFLFTYGQDIPDQQVVMVERKSGTVQDYLDDLFGGSIYGIEYGNKLILRYRDLPPKVYTVRGRVVDAITGEALVGVTVIIPEMEPLQGAVSDESGMFQIDVPVEMNMIRFSCIGYKSTSRTLYQSEQSYVELDPTHHLIEEITVTEHHSNPLAVVQRIPLGFLSAEKAGIPQVATIDHLLQGTMAGVMANRNSGMPGASMQIRIRGRQSLISSDPVYYLNDVPIQAALVHALSPRDIESVEVYKDASVSAAYGATGANGVISMYTKKGTESKAAGSMSYYYGYQQPSSTYDLMNKEEYLSYFQEVFPGRIHSKEESEFDNNHLDHLFHGASTEEFHLSLAGGDNGSSVYSSAGYFRQSSVIKDLEFRRYSFSLIRERAPHERLHLGQSLLLSHMSYEGLKEGHFLNERNNPILSSMIRLPMEDIADSTGLPRPGPEATLPNPNDDAALVNNCRKNYALLGDLSLSYRLHPSLSLMSQLGVDLLYQDNENYCPYRAGASVNKNNPILGSAYAVLDLGWYWVTRLRYEQVFREAHAIKAHLGFSMKQHNNQWITQELTYLDKDLEPMPDVLVTPEVPSGKLSPGRDHTQRSLFGSASYVYREKYFLDLLLRHDRVGYNYERSLQTLSALFPSVSAGWVFSRENLPQTLDLISYGRLRYNWGKAGNSPGMDYSFYAGMMREQEYLFAFNSGGYFTNTASKRQVNRRFYWETARAHTLGLDLGFFRNSLSISMDFFWNLLEKGKSFPVDMPEQYFRYLYNSEFPQRQLPLASIRNRGMECTLSYHTAGRKIQWTMDVHLTHVRNEVLEVVENGTNHSNDKDFDHLSVNLPGHAAGSFYGYRIEKRFGPEDCEIPGGPAVNQPFVTGADGTVEYAQPDAKEGDYKFMDLNGDGCITREDRCVLGDPNPDFSMGIFSSLSYRQFECSILLQGVYGNQIFNATRLWLYNPIGLSNWAKDMENTYIPSAYGPDGEFIPPGNIDSDLHRFDMYDRNWNLRASDFYIEDGSYLRLKYLELAYNWKVGIIKKAGLEGIRIYFSIHNLYTLTRYSGLDPEVGGWGIDCGIYPQPRTYMAGIQIGF